MDITDIIKEGVYSGHSDEDVGECAEENKLRWEWFTRSAILAQYEDRSFAIYAQNKGAAYVAKIKFFRKIKANKVNIRISYIRDADSCILNHPAFRQQERE